MAGMEMGRKGRRAAECAQNGGQDDFNKGNWETDPEAFGGWRDIGSGGSGADRAGKLPGSL